MKGKLYFIALVPGPEIREEVTAFKQYAADRFDSSQALNSPPHVTLFPPFRWPDEERPRLRGVLQSFAAGQAPFAVELRNFDRFGSRVIFVDVRNSPELEALQAGLRTRLAWELDLDDRDDRPFHPHMTVAFKDLQRSVFPEAWKHFSGKTYQRSFSAEHLTLLRHEGRRWEIDGEFPFRNH